MLFSPAQTQREKRNRPGRRAKAFPLALRKAAVIDRPGGVFFFGRRQNSAAGLFWLDANQWPPHFFLSDVFCFNLWHWVWWMKGRMMLWVKKTRSFNRLLAYRTWGFGRRGKASWWRHSSLGLLEMTWGLWGFTYFIKEAVFIDCQLWKL